MTLLTLGLLSAGLLRQTRGRCTHRHFAFRARGTGFQDWQSRLCHNLVLPLSYNCLETCFRTVQGVAYWQFSHKKVTRIWLLNSVLRKWISLRKYFLPFRQLVKTSIHDRIFLVKKIIRCSLIWCSFGNQIRSSLFLRTNGRSCPTTRRRSTWRCFGNSSFVWLSSRPSKSSSPTRTSSESSWSSRFVFQTENLVQEENLGKITLSMPLDLNILLSEHLPCR